MTQADDNVESLLQRLKVKEELYKKQQILLEQQKASMDAIVYDLYCSQYYQAENIKTPNDKKISKYRDIPLAICRIFLYKLNDTPFCI